jgi:hypothetical protein
MVTQGSVELALLAEREGSAVAAVVVALALVAAVAVVPAVSAAAAVPALQALAEAALGPEAEHPEARHPEPAVAAAERAWEEPSSTTPARSP